MKKDTYIYSLGFKPTPDSERVVFYIGRTQDPARRSTDHKTAVHLTDKHNEYKYQWARNLEACGIDWDFKLETDMPIEDNKYSEYAFVLKYARANEAAGIHFIDGMPLTNMKAGDFLIEILEFKDIKTADEIKTWHKDWQQKKRKQKDPVLTKDEFWTVFYERQARRVGRGPVPTDAAELRQRAQEDREDFEADMAEMEATGTVPADMPAILSKKKK